MAACFASLVVGAALLLGPGKAPVSALAAIVIIGGLLVAVLRGHNWAGITLAVLTVVGFLSTLPVLRLQLAYGSLVAGATLVNTILQFAGLVLLFIPKSRGWFVKSAA